MAQQKLYSVALLVILLAGCRGKQERTSARPENHPIPKDALEVRSEGTQGGTLRYALQGEPSTFNFLAARDSRSKLMTYLTTATLLEFDAVQQKAVPGIAKEWQISEDGLTVNLDVREGINFSDGRPLTVEDVLFTFAKIYQDDSNNDLKDSLLIKGKPLQVSRTSSNSFKIVFPERYAAIEYMLTKVPVLPRHRFSESGKRIEEYWNLNTPAEQMAGLGPFTTATHQPGQETLFRYNPHYWKVDRNGTRLPYLDEVAIQYIADRNTQLLRFQSGQLDLVDQLLRPEDFLQLKEGGEKFALHSAGSSSSLSIYWFNLNTGVDEKPNRPFLSPGKKDWFTNLYFRRAVSTGISRDAIVKNVYLGQAKPAWSLVPASISQWHAKDVPKYEYSPDRARQLLREGGFSWKTEGPRELLVDSRHRPVKFELLTRADDILQKTAALIQQDLEKLGMQVTLKQEEFRSVISRVMGSFNYDSALMNLDFPVDPADHVNVLLSSAPMHMWRPNQPQPATTWENQIDELMLKQRTALNIQQRQGFYREVQKILAEQVAFVPLANRDVFIAAAPQLKNLKPTNLFPFGLWNVWELYKENPQQRRMSRVFPLNVHPATGETIITARQW